MMMCDAEWESIGFKKHFNSLIKQVQEENLDIIVTTDYDDRQMHEEIYPSSNLVLLTIHSCWYNLINDGKQARWKIIDSLSYAYEKFKGWL